MLLLQIAEVNHEQVNSGKQELYHDSPPSNDIMAGLPRAHSGSSRENQKACMPRRVGDATNDPKSRTDATPFHGPTHSCQWKRPSVSWRSFLQQRAHFCLQSQSRKPADPLKLSPSETGNSMNQSCHCAKSPLLNVTHCSRHGFRCPGSLI